MNKYFPRGIIRSSAILFTIFFGVGCLFPAEEATAGMAEITILHTSVVTAHFFPCAT